MCQCHASVPCSCICSLFVFSRDEQQYSSSLTLSYASASVELQAMREDPHPSVAPDIVTYGSLTAAMERGGQWHRALEVYEQMQVRGWNVTWCWRLTPAGC